MSVYCIFTTNCRFLVYIYYLYLSKERFGHDMEPLPSRIAYNSVLGQRSAAEEHVSRNSYCGEHARRGHSC